MARKQLILLRHAKSDWASDAQSDFERPLSARGRRDAPKMGRWLAENGYTPDSIIASPSARTTQTSELICAALGCEAERVVYERRLYHCMAGEIQKIAARQLQRFDRVLIIAHNPAMELALLAYCPATESFADGKLMPTCAAAVIEFGGERENHADANLPGATLCALMRPSLL